MQPKPSKKNEIKRRTRMLAIFWIPVAALILGAAAPELWAGEDDDDEEIPFTDAEIYFELNNTDGDLGIHALIDGDPWKRLRIEDTNERKMLDVKVRGRLRQQGLTEIFFESAEPNFDELDPEDFFHRFPEGEYEVEGITLEGEEMESEVELTHLLPAPPANIMISGFPAAEDCDADPLPEVAAPVIISWDPVTLSHPELGITNAPIEVVQYQVVVEQLGLGLTFSIELPPTTTEVQLPESFTELGDEIKFEILVREESGNQTAVESCFELED